MNRYFRKTTKLNQASEGFFNKDYLFRKGRKRFANNS